MTHPVIETKIEREKMKNKENEFPSQNLVSDQRAKVIKRDKSNKAKIERIDCCCLGELVLKASRAIPKPLRACLMPNPRKENPEYLRELENPTFIWFLRYM